MQHRSAYMQERDQNDKIARWERKEKLEEMREENH